MFGSVFSSNSTLDDTGSTPPSLTPSNHTLRPIYVSLKDVVSALSELDTRKAYGHNGIPPVALKTCSVELAPFPAKLFRLSLKTETFPSNWKFALVHPVPKKGDHSNPSNYRPIALILSLIHI